ncbi:glycosyltransferase family 4 protein [Paracidovorax citrulli]|uniref:glycosyltransferase family 4 protein n=1 Tax=uncultured Stenotrophomonas sp. TaxID=165438 RepID=UPI0028D50658|nr:glycosyltransferase family 4 protein [uncultured Stenotrophomonas sp.]
MKLIWATPYSENSAIARYSEAVVAELRDRGHHVAIYRTEVGADLELPPRENACVLEHGSQEELHWFHEADLVIANIGDHYAYHGGVFELAQKRPYVAVLHDWCVLNFFWGWLIANHRSHDAPRVIASMYGQQAGELCATATWDNLLERATQHFPLTEWISSDTLGCIIHSEFYGERVRQSCAGPVHKLSLAYPVDAFDREHRPATQRGGALAVRTFGMVNPNKRIDRVIRALALDPELAARTNYHVLGPVDDSERRRLEQVCAEVGFAGLTFEGRVSNGRLHDGMAEADVICCLRDPALEGASASAIEGMQSGAPVIVSDAGFYAELPDEYVLKVGMQDPEQDLLRHLRFVDRQRAEARKMGMAAAAWAAHEFSASHYVDGLEKTIPGFIAAEPYVLNAQELGRELGRMGLPGNSRPAAKITNTLERMFDL